MRLSGTLLASPNFCDSHIMGVLSLAHGIFACEDYSGDKMQGFVLAICLEARSRRICLRNRIVCIQESHSVVSIRYLW